MTIQHFPRELVARADPDPFTPHEGPFVWYALGDSYTAGPGAGDEHPSNEGECFRSTGSYAPQLQADWIYSGENQLNFLACTGAVTDTVLKDQLPEVNSDPPPDVVVMTLGGNDIGFAKIAKACLVGLLGSGKCDDKIAEYVFPSIKVFSILGANCEQTSARRIMDNLDDPFWARLNEVYDKVFDQMPRNDFHYQMIHLGYSKFFNVDAESTWCNDQTFGKIGFSGLRPPKLTLELRKKLNDLTDQWNSKLYAHLLGYVWRKLNGPEDDRWHRTRLFYGLFDNKDPYSFNGHRFCEPGVEDPKFQDPSTWFFGVWGDQKDAEVSADHFKTLDAASCASDPKYDRDDAFAWDCDMAVYYADPNTDHDLTTIAGDDFIRSFHPKSSGFESIKRYLAVQIKKIRRVPPIGECIAAPGPDLDDLAPLPSGIPASQCAIGPGTYATTLEEPKPTTTDAPPPTETTPPATPTPDMDSEECLNCSGDLGASNCPAEDLACLHDECRENDNCKKCQMKCDEVGGVL